MVWWRKNMVPIHKGQRWRKRAPVHEKEFICVVVGKGKRDGIKTHCSDGCSHNFLKRVLYERFELIDE